jgi:hypothetical protein
MLFKEFTVLLNPQSRKIIFGICLNAIGGGMTLSLLLVYLHDMRGFTNTFGGLLLAYGSIVSILASTYTFSSDYHGHFSQYCRSGNLAKPERDFDSGHSRERSPKDLRLQFYVT